VSQGSRITALSLSVGVVLALFGLGACSSSDVATSSSAAAASLGSSTMPPTSVSSASSNETSTSTITTVPLALTGERAQLYVEIQRIREGVAARTLVFDWNPGPGSDLPSDPMELLDSLEQGLLSPLVTIYLKQDAGDALALRREIAARPEVERLLFVSKDEALARLKEEFKDNPEILAGLEGHTLPAYLEIWLSDHRKAEAFATEFRNRPEVAEAKAAGTLDCAALIALLRRITRPAIPSGVTSHGATEKQTNLVELVVGPLPIANSTGNVTTIPPR